MNDTSPSEEDIARLLKESLGGEAHLSHATKEHVLECLLMQSRPRRPLRDFPPHIVAILTLIMGVTLAISGLDLFSGEFLRCLPGRESLLLVLALNLLVIPFAATVIIMKRKHHEPSA